MIPFYKAFSLILRVLSKPLLSYTKRVHSSRQAQNLKIRQLFIQLGNFYHRFDSTINRRFLKITSQFAYKPLNDELALQKGIDFFYQILFYLIVLGLPIYELYRGSEESAQKSAEVNKKLTNLENGVQQATNKLELIIRELEKGIRSDFL